MPSRRSQIEMTPEEQEEFLAAGWTLQVASIGTQGYPHLVAMWYGMIDGEIHFTTFAKAQKLLNLERDPRITCMLESGEQYQELRGLVVEGDAEVIQGDPDLVLQVMAAIGVKRGGGDGNGDAAMMPSDVQRKQAAKRAVVRVHAKRVISWDHNKLGGTY
jgi:PPOX class probable F420-dependent enzyme